MDFRCARPLGAGIQCETTFVFDKRIVRHEVFPGALIGGAALPGDRFVWPPALRAAGGELVGPLTWLNLV